MMIPEAINIKDQGIIEVIPQAHKVVRNVVIHRDPKMLPVNHILLFALAANVPHVQKMLKLVKR